MTSFSEAISLPHGIFLEASPEKFRLHRLPLWQGFPRDEILEEHGVKETTRNLMAGAFYASLSQVRVENKAAFPITLAAPSLLRHIHSLLSSYQTAHATPSTMRAVALRLTERDQLDAAAHCLTVAEEEFGHDTLALMDLASLGLPAQEIVDRQQPKNAVRLVALFKQLAESTEPISVLGYAYVLERSALFSTEETIQQIEKLLPRGVCATRCLRVHSAVGSDAGHVDESIAFMATLPPQDRTAIARAVFQAVYLLYGVEPDYPGDAAMNDILRQYGWTHAEAALACAVA